MLLDQFSKYVLRGRRQAIVIALLFTMLPMFGWVSVVVIGLVTLCKGPYEGFLVLMWSALPYVVFAVKGMWLPLVINVALGGCLVWILAVILRRFAKWSWLLEGLSLFGIVAIFVAHWFMPQLQSVWSAKLLGVMKLMEGHLGSYALPADKLKILVNEAAYYATGVQTCYIIFTVLVELAFARMLQARLLFPGRLMQEWLRLRLNYLAPVILLIVIGLAVWGPAQFKDLVPVAILPFLIVGVGFMHGMFCRIKPARVWLFYMITIVLVLVLPLVIGGLLVLLAMFDTVLPIRKRLA